MRCLITKSPKINKITVTTSKFWVTVYVVCNFIMVINTRTSYYKFSTVLSPHGLKNEIYCPFVLLVSALCFIEQDILHILYLLDQMPGRLLNFQHFWCSVYSRMEFIRGRHLFKITFLKPLKQFTVSVVLVLVMVMVLVYSSLLFSVDHTT